MDGTQNAELDKEAIELDGVPSKEEDQEDEGPEGGYSESLEHYQVIVRDGVAERAIVLSVDEAFVVVFVSLGDRARIRCDLDVVGEDEGEQEKEEEDEDEKPKVEEHQSLDLLQHHQHDRHPHDRNQKEENSEEHR